MIRTSLSILAIASVLSASAPALAQEAHSFRQVTVTSAAGQVVSAGLTETVEVLLADGTSIILAPGASIQMSFGASGAYAVNIKDGLVRISGGLNNAATPISITTPDAQLRLSSGAAIVAVEAGQTRAHLLNGEALLVTAGGASREIYRSGFQVVATNGRLSRPTRLDQAELIADIEALSEGLEAGALSEISVPVAAIRETQQSDQGEPPEVQIDLALSNDILVDDIEVPMGNSETEPPPTSPPVTPLIVQPTIPPIVEPVTPPEQGFDLEASLGDLGGFAPATGETSGDISLTSSSTIDTNHQIKRQSAAEVFPEADFYEENEAISSQFSSNVFLGPTTNTIYPTASLSFAVESPENLSSISKTGPVTGSLIGVEYYEATTSSGLFETNRSATAVDEGAIRFLSYAFSGEGILGPVYSRHIDNDESVVSSHTTFGLTEAELDPDFGLIGTEDIWHRGKGVVATGLRFDQSVPAIFNDPLDPSSGLLQEPDRKNHFLFLDMKVVASVNFFGTTGSITGWDDEFSNAIEAEETRLGGRLLKSFEYDGSGSMARSALISDPNETRRFVFASGSVDEVVDVPNPLGFVDRFSLSAGMVGPIVTGIDKLTPGMHLTDGSRAFFRSETWTELDDDFASSTFALETAALTQSDFYVINPDKNIVDTSGGDNFTNPKLFYADIGLATDADGNQVSTISALIGQLHYRFEDELEDAALVGITKTTDAIVTGRAIGSARGIGDKGQSKTATLLTSDYRSTAAGGGNPNIDRPGTTARMGFFVLENAGQVFDDVASATNTDVGTLRGGTENTVGGGSQTFASLRLGVARTSDEAPQDRTGFSSTDSAFGAAILDVEKGGNVMLARLGGPDLLDRENASASIAPNIAFSAFDAIDNSFSATLDGIALGGTNGNSAYINDQIYGARSSGTDSDVALISGPSVAKGLPTEFQKRVSGYEHIKWGFFFGDLDNTLNSRRHAHLGSFAGGTPLSAADAAAITSAAKNTTATVRYQGHTIGNVVQNGRVTTQTGGYTDEFDFSSRTGKASISLGSASLSGPSSASKNLGAYTGSLTGGGLTGELNGRFVGRAVSKAGYGPSSGDTVLAPGGVAGSFAISDGSTGGYRAVGTFGGE